MLMFGIPYMMYSFDVKFSPLNTSSLFTFQCSKLPSYQKLWMKLTQTLESGFGALSGNPDVHMNYVHQQDYVFITDEMTVEIEQSKSCEISVGREKYMPMKYGVGLQNNSVYTDMISLV